MPTDWDLSKSDSQTQDYYVRKCFLTLPVSALMHLHIQLNTGYKKTKLIAILTLIYSQLFCLISDILRSLAVPARPIFLMLVVEPCPLDPYLVIQVMVKTLDLLRESHLGLTTDQIRRQFELEDSISITP